MEIPSEPTPFKRPLGSFREKANPMHPATGASVIYLLLKDAMIPIIILWKYKIFVTEARVIFLLLKMQ